MFAADNADNDEIAPAPGPVSSEGSRGFYKGLGFRGRTIGFHQDSTRVLEAHGFRCSRKGGLAGVCTQPGIAGSVAPYVSESSEP